MFKNYFNYTVPSVLAKELYQIKNKNKNSSLVNNIKNALKELKEEIKKMSEDEIKTEKPYRIMDIVEKSLSLMKKTNMEEV